MFGLFKKKVCHAVTGQPAPEGLDARLSSRKAVALPNGVTVTDSEIVFVQQYKRVYVPFHEIVWAYRQVAEGVMKIGLAKGKLSEHRVLLYTAPDKSVMVIFDHEEPAKKLLQLIEKKTPSCAIGFTAENKAKFGVR